ncbi:hypothetical protein GCM10008929_20600 [Alkalibacterium psychrotolerans]
MKNKKLRKSVDNKSIAGVCGGIAEYFGLAPTGVRLVFLLTPGPFMLILYIILANTLPEGIEYL